MKQLSKLASLIQVIGSIVLFSSLVILALSIRIRLSCALPKLSRLTLPYQTIF